MLVIIPEPRTDACTPVQRKRDHIFSEFSNLRRNMIVILKIFYSYNSVILLEAEVPNCRVVKHMLTTTK